MDARPDAPAATATVAGPWLATAGAAATVLGIAVHGVWRALPAERFALALVLAGIVVALGWPARRWLGWRAASTHVLAWTLALIVYVGPLSVLAVLLLGAAAWCVGERLVPVHAPSRAPLAIAVGLMLIAMLAGWTVTLPIHRPLVWGPVLLAPVALRWRALAAALRATHEAWRAAVDDAPRAASLAVLALGVASVACWIPAMQSDDVGYHLGLPSQWQLLGRYAPDAEVQVWAFAPWAGDVLHGIAAVLSRQEAHGALNALWLAVTAALIGGPLATTLGATARERWAAVALFATFPSLVWMAAGLQTELASTAVLVALASLLLAPVRDTVTLRAWFAGAVLAAGLFALKLVHVAAVMPLLAYAAWRHRTARGWGLLPVAVVVALLLGTSSHLHAWLATGNPVLPMFNHVFASPYFPPEQFNDPRWHAGFGADLLWHITFDTTRYVEGWDGGLGFGLIALAGLWAWRLVQPPHRALFLAVTLVVLLPLVPLQYARYTWPGIVLLCALLAFGAEATLGRRAFTWLFAGLCVLNLAYQANSSWLHHSAAVKRTLRSLGDHDAVLPHYLPERILLRAVPRTDADLVLASDPARNVVAELAGRGRTVSPHDPSLAADAARANADGSGTAWAALLARERIRWVLVTRATASPALDAGLRQAGATRTQALEGIELWALPSATEPAR